MKKTLRLNNLKTRTAMKAKISVFICVGAIIYLLLYNLHDGTFNKLQAEVTFDLNIRSVTVAWGVLGNLI